MTRKRYFMFFIPLILLVIFVSESIDARKGVVDYICQFGAGILAWFVVWFRLSFLGYRKEMAFIPTLPIFISSFNGIAFVTNDATPPLMPFFNLTMVICWLATIIVLAITFVPDEKIPDTKRMDSLSIMCTVIISYFCLSQALPHLTRSLDLSYMGIIS